MTEDPKIIWPWQTKTWPAMKSSIAEKINSIVDMDTKISARMKAKPRQISSLFSKYYENGSAQFPENVVLGEIIPFMQKLVDGAPKLFQRVDSRILRAGITGNNALTRPQVATLIACMWFGLFRHEYISRGNFNDFTDPSLFGMFESQNVFALSCILNYFDRVRKYMTQTDRDAVDRFMAGVIIMKRTALTTRPDWHQSSKKISAVSLGEGKLDDTSAKMSVVCSHEHIGGEMFSRGSLSHDELTLLTRPECLASILYCPKLESNETLTVFGAERFSKYNGYGSSITYTGNVVDPVNLGYSRDNTEVMAQCASIFMNVSSNTSGQSQFVDDFRRDLDKAYCGFSSFSTRVVVAIGPWSYGFNGSNMQLRFFQQLLAASMAGVDLLYYAPGTDYAEETKSFLAWIEEARPTVGELMSFYADIIKGHGKKSINCELNLFDCLYKL